MAAAAALIQEQEQQIRTQSYYPDNVTHNAKQVEYVRSTSLSVAGSMAGVLGLTNFTGFGFYAISVLIVNLVVLGLNARGTPSKYFVSPSPPTQPLRAASKSTASEASSLSVDPRSGIFAPTDIAMFLINGLTENAFSFILWWTFWYGIVHVYD